jgi:dTDP-4-dehydrorhamnose reductase
MRDPGGRPRATLVAQAAKALVRDGAFDHPLLRQPGWWRRDDRFIAPARRTAAG